MEKKYFGPVWTRPLLLRLPHCHSAECADAPTFVECPSVAKKQAEELMRSPMPNARKEEH
eukprot:716938-Amphidinium_carterae.1